MPDFLSRLLRLPAVGDNAAMHVEPPNADPPKRKRRCFQFSLRTLLIAVALVALACSLSAGVARFWRERQSELDKANKLDRHRYRTIEQARSLSRRPPRSRDTSKSNMRYMRESDAMLKWRPFEAGFLPGSTELANTSLQLRQGSHLARTTTARIGQREDRS
jgi:cytoskeletal protein RodZ